MKWEEAMKASGKRTRVVIEKVTPEVDGGCFAAKRIVGDTVIVEADIFADSHDSLSAILQYKKDGDSVWSETAMKHLANDRWRASFKVKQIGRYRYSLVAWVDRFRTWKQMMLKKIKAEQNVDVELRDGLVIIQEVMRHATPDDTASIKSWIDVLSSGSLSGDDKAKLLRNSAITKVMDRYSERRNTVNYKELEVVVDHTKARFSTWYEMFPRSLWQKAGTYGTLRDCESRIPYIAEMGFDVLYLPPIHPIGYTNRKGKNNDVTAKPEDPGTPWAIGSAEGGHKSIHPQLGTLADFGSLLKKARQYNIEIAMDIALQCSPDHPYVNEHPEWFRRRADGTIKYAENPPKKYEDIYPLDFEIPHWQELWEELKSIFLFWIEHGIRIFRVDNPHTKPFAFWEWLIGDIKKNYPEVIFLAEAFTRPKTMYRLAKLGFTQSYSYFTWRNTKWELEQYLKELTQTEVKEYFRPNFWPNTPDILSDYLRDGGRPAFMVRLVLAATLGVSYGIYGPAYELCVNRRKNKKSEEYLNSEKYEIKHWDVDNPDSLRNFIAKVNHIRSENAALQQFIDISFHHVDNDHILCYSKNTKKLNNVILMVVNLDYQNVQSAMVDLDLSKIGLERDQSYVAHDLLTDTRYQWYGAKNYVELDPCNIPAHILRIEKMQD